MKLKSSPEKLAALLAQREETFNKRQEAAAKKAAKEAARKEKERQRVKAEKEADRKMDEKIRMESIGELDPVIRDIYRLGEPETVEDGKKIYEKLMNTFFAKNIINDENRNRNQQNPPIEKETISEKEIMESKTENVQQEEKPLEKPVEVKTTPVDEEKTAEEIKTPAKLEVKKGIAFPKKNTQPKEIKTEEDSSDDYFDVSKKPRTMSNPMLSANPFR